MSDRGVAETSSVCGTITIPEAGLPGFSAEVIIQVEDISRADAKAVVVAEQRQKFAHLCGGASISFSIEVPSELIDKRHLYSVRVHADVSGSGDVEAGDLVTTQTYPVLTRGRGGKVHVELRLV